jgi:hypothetical protein
MGKWRYLQAFFLSTYLQWNVAMLALRAPHLLVCQHLQLLAQPLARLQAWKRKAMPLSHMQDCFSQVWWLVERQNRVGSSPLQELRLQAQPSLLPSAQQHTLHLTVRGRITSSMNPTLAACKGAASNGGKHAGWPGGSNSGKRA